MPLSLEPHADGNLLRHTNLRTPRPEKGRGGHVQPAPTPANTGGKYRVRPPVQHFDGAVLIQSRGSRSHEASAKDNRKSRRHTSVWHIAACADPTPTVPSTNANLRTSTIVQSVRSCPFSSPCGRPNMSRYRLRRDAHAVARNQALRRRRTRLTMPPNPWKMLPPCWGSSPASCSPASADGQKSSSSRVCEPPVKPKCCTWPAQGTASRNDSRSRGGETYCMETRPSRQARIASMRPKRAALHTAMSKKVIRLAARHVEQVVRLSRTRYNAIHHKSHACGSCAALSSVRTRVARELTQKSWRRAMARQTRAADT